jgi:hypothetical protein
LTPCEIRIAKGIAALRRRNNRDRGWTDRKHTDLQEGSEIDVQGLLGEFAFCKQVNAWPDLGWVVNEPWDCRYAGRKVDVKCSPKRTVLAVSLHKAEAEQQPDVFVLMQQVDEQTYEFVGWQFADVVYKGPKCEGRDGVPYFCYPASDLETCLWY